MAITLVDLTGNVADILSTTFDSRRTKVWVETNVEGDMLVDTATDQVRLGSATQTLDADGSFTFTNLIASNSADIEPFNFQYRLWVDYADPASKQRTRQSFGWFSLTATSDLSDVVEEQYVPPTWLTAAVTTLSGYVDDAESARDAAEDSADDAETAAAAAAVSAALAGTISGLTGEDSAVATLIGSTSDTRSAGDARWVATISPTDPLYGAAGNDTADDTAELQAALDAAAAFGLAVDGRGLTYKTTDDLDVPDGSTLSNIVLRCTGTGKKILHVTGSGVTLRNVSVIGRHVSATYSAGEYGIFLEGASAAAPLRGLLLENVTVDLVGDHGVGIKHVNGFRLKNIDVADVGYAGVGTFSALNGSGDGITVDNVVGKGTPINAYGIHFSRAAEITSLVTAPRSYNISLTDVKVSNVPWEGIDTHGGEKIRISDFAVLGCKVGIAIVADDIEGNVTTYAAKQFGLSNGVIDSLVTDGSAGAGIEVAGAPGASAGVVAVDYATGTLSNITIRNHGKQSDNIDGAIFMRNTEGIAGSNINIQSPSPCGLCLYYDNRGISFTGLTVSDAWSNTTVLASAVNVRSSNNTGTINGLALRTTGAKAGATTINGYGIYDDGTTGTDIALGPSNLVVATLPISAASTGVLHTFESNVWTKKQIYAKNGTAALPSYSFNADKDMGFYLANVDELAVTVAGTLRMRWLTTGILIAAAGYKYTFGASATSGASIRLPHGTAPTSPVDGDMWTTTAGAFVRINGVTKTFTLT